MYTLKGIFPEPKKDHKKNFIKENMKQLKFVQGKTTKEPKFVVKNHPPRLNSQTSKQHSELSHVKSSPSNRSGKVTLNVGKASSMSTHKKITDVRIQKGDMAEFLKRKELRKTKAPETTSDDQVESEESLSCLRDVGCQTIESNLAQKLAESAKLTVLYPKEEEAKMKASGDMARYHGSPTSLQKPQRSGDEVLKAEDILESERQRSRLNAILERKDTRDPYLPSGYQKGVLPKYLRERKDQGPKEAEGAKSDDAQAMCPPGHVTLPDTERKETLRMLRNSFAELVSELNKMPVKTDTLKMRNRKIELEKQLAKLEEGIKVFSRPKVFVKMGE